VITSAIEFREPTLSQQWIARSPWSVGSAVRWLSLSARWYGWQLDPSSSSRALQLRREHDRLGVVVLAQDRGATGSIAVLTRWRVP
jgi:hypothetical protein